MGQSVISGRFTAVPETETVTVFLIGMRANRWWKFGKLLPMSTAMARMLNHLVATPEAGLLGFHSWFGRTTIMLSYWESPEHLQRFAADRRTRRKLRKGVYTISVAPSSDRTTRSAWAPGSTTLR